MERCYVIVWQLKNSEEAGIECVTLSFTQAERRCQELEEKNSGKIYYWIPSFLEPNI